MQVQPKYFLILSDALIPLLGVFFWDWGLYFILLFYIIDLLAREALMHLKTHRIYLAQGLKNREKWFVKGVISLALFLLSITVIHLAVWWTNPSISFGKEIVNFWTYKELGIQQGYLLFPLVAYAAYAQYKMTFLMTGKARKVLMDSLWKQHFVALLLIIAGAIVGGVTVFFLGFSDTLTVCLIVAAVACYSYFFEKI
jgi:hypothetical protein